MLTTARKNKTHVLVPNRPLDIWRCMDVDSTTSQCTVVCPAGWLDNILQNKVLLWLLQY